ncbi:MAG TPA: polysaccharide biosynthesis tyrosine autokinase [Blastocatellia bacterium]|nr:polysaccharide biosynthesis tyrosine autokinase [Blastocatellia bacterium]
MVHLRDYLRMVRKRLWLIAGIAAFVPMLTAIYMARKPDVYLAQALLQVDSEDANQALVNSKNSSVVLSNAANESAYFNTQLRILTSPGLLRRVTRTLDLEHQKGFLEREALQQHSTWQGLIRMVGLGNQDGEKEKSAKEGENPQSQMSPPAAPQTAISPATAHEGPMEAERLARYVKELGDNLQVEPVIDKRLGYGRDITRLIEIRFSNHDPQMAAKVANAIADVHALASLERKAEKNVSTGDFLQKRIAELQAQIRTGEERLIAYAKSNQILSLDANQNTVVERLTGLNRQLLEAENERKLAETSYQAALAPGAALALAEENTNKQANDLKTKLAELRQRRAQLLVENTERWPEVQEITQQIGVVEKEIDSARVRSTDVMLTNLQTRYRQAQAREQSLRNSFNQQRGETLTQNEAAINYRIIQQEIETNKELLNGLLQNYKENDVVLAGVYNNVRVIDYASAPDRPVGPRRLQSVLLALFFSLPIGVGLAILLEYLDSSIVSVDDVEKVLQLPALVAVPATKELRQAQWQPEGTFKTAPNSSLAEAYRQLRTAILLSTPGRAPKTLLVTSSLPSEGKTTTAVNLAVSLAATTEQVKVLIIDGDLRRPRLRSIFKMRSGPGLSSYLSSGMAYEELRTIIEYRPACNLHLLTAGPIPPNPAELLGSERMRHLISTLEDDFNYIVIDSAPAASLTDAVLLSLMVDGVLLVVRSGVTPREVVLRSRQMLLGAGAKIFGVILNQLSQRSTGYYYQNYKYTQQQTNAEQGGDAPPSTPAPESARDLAPELQDHLPPDPQEEAFDDEPSIDDYLPPKPARARLARSRFSVGGAGQPEVARNWDARLIAGPLHADSVAAPESRANSGERRTANGDPIDEDRFQTLCTTFDDPSRETREEAAAEILSDQRNSINLLTRALREASPARRRRIGSALGSSGALESALDDLASGDPAQTAQASSLLFLAAKAGEIRPLLRAVQERPENEVRVTVIELLASSGQAEVLPALSDLAHSESLPPAVYAAVMEAIYQLRGASR